MQDTEFEQWASARYYDTAPALFPSELRRYADRRTQEVYEAWRAGAHYAQAQISGDPAKG